MLLYCCLFHLHLQRGAAIRTNNRGGHKSSTAFVYTVIKNGVYSCRLNVELLNLIVIFIILISCKENRKASRLIVYFLKSSSGNASE